MSLNLIRRSGVTANPLGFCITITWLTPLTFILFCWTIIAVASSMPMQASDGWAAKADKQPVVTASCNKMLINDSIGQ